MSLQISKQDVGQPHLHGDRMLIGVVFSLFPHVPPREALA